MGTSAQERIALSVDSTANTQPIRQTREEVDKLTADTKKFNEEMRKNGGDMIAAAKAAAGLADNEEKLAASIQKRGMAMAAAHEQALKMDAALKRETESLERLHNEALKANQAFDVRRMTQLHTEALRMNAAFDQQATKVEALSPKLRTTANAVVLLSNAAVTGQGSLTGIAVAAGNAAQGIATIATSARVAAAATGIGAFISVITLGIGLLQHFREESQKSADEARKFASDLAGIARAQNLGGASAKAQALFSGDPFAVRGEFDKNETERQFQIRRIGLQGLKKEMADLRAIQQDNTSEWDRAQIKIRELEPILAEQNRRHQEALRIVTLLAQREGELAANARQRIRDQIEEGLTPTVPGLSTIPSIPGVRAGIPGRHLQVTGQATATALAARQQAALIPDSAFHQMQVELLTAWDEKVAKPLAVGIGSTLADAIGAGITGGFKGATDAARAGLGGLLVTVGSTLIQAGLPLKALEAAILANPLFAGGAAIAAGVLLVGLGKALGGAMRGGAAGATGAAATGSSFVPTAGVTGGSQTIIIQTVDPRSRAVIEETRYYLQRADILKNPTVLPAAGLRAA